MFRFDLLEKPSKNTALTGIIGLIHHFEETGKNTLDARILGAMESNQRHVSFRIKKEECIGVKRVEQL